MRLFMIETTGIWISPWTVSMSVWMSITTEKQILVIDKSFCSKILESMRLIFSKNVVWHNGNRDNEEGNSLLFRSRDHNCKQGLSNLENYD